MGARAQRWEPLAGVVFAALLVTGGLLYSTGMAYGAATSEVAAFFEDASRRISYGGGLVVLSAAPLLWFVGCIRRRLVADGDDGHLAGIVHVAGAASAALVLAAGAIVLGAADRTRFGESLSAAEAATAWDLSGGLLGVALPVAMAVLIAATVVAASRSGWFAPAATWLSWVLVVGLLIIPVAWMFAGGAVVWIAAVSSVMTRAPATTDVPIGRPRTT